VGRFAVLGQLGGHREVDPLSMNFEEYRVMLDRYVFFVFWPFRHFYPERTVGWAVLVAALAALVGVGLRLADRRTRLLVGVGLAWVAGFGAFFILLRHVAGPWYLYYPLLGLGLAVGAALDGLLKSRRAGVLAACGGVYTLGSLVGSPLVRPYDQWHQAGAIMHQYLAGIAACSEGLPDGTAITLWNAPRLFDDGTDESFLILPSMIEGFTYDAYMHLIHPERQFNLFIGQPVTYTSNPPDLLVTCGWGGNNRRRVVATSTSLPLPDFPTD
jgi:drug/metabolite transporter superfamily protein YnfA